MTAGSVVGHDVPKQDARRAGAERARRLHELELARPQHLPAHQPRVAHPADHRQRQDDVRQARAEHRDERDRQQDARETPAARRSTRLIDIVEPPAEVAGDRAEQHADDRRDADDGEADEQRDARAGEHARKDVAAELVEAERMLEARAARAAAPAPASTDRTGRPTAPTIAATTVSSTMAAPTLITIGPPGCADRGSRR